MILFIGICELKKFGERKHVLPLNFWVDYTEYEEMMNKESLHS